MQTACKMMCSGSLDLNGLIKCTFEQAHECFSDKDREKYFIYDKQNIAHRINMYLANQY